MIYVSVNARGRTEFRVDGLLIPAETLRAIMGRAGTVAAVAREFELPEKAVAGVRSPSVSERLSLMLAEAVEADDATA